MVAGDWNITADQLQAASCPGVVNGVIKQPDRPSCNGKIYDFFVVSKTLESSVVAVTTMDNGAFHPHSAVRMLVSGAARHKAVRRLMKPTPVKPWANPWSPPNASTNPPAQNTRGWAKLAPPCRPSSTS